MIRCNFLHEDTLEALAAPDLADFKTARVAGRLGDARALLRALHRRGAAGKAGSGGKSEHLSS